MSRKNLMRAGLAAAGLVLVCAAGAFGQVRVSGIEHTPLGGATLGPVTERRLPVSNLGSSGQDGVRMVCNSSVGCEMSLDLDGLLAPSPEAREIRMRPKGWDGTIKGRMRLASRPPDGLAPSLDVECDYSLVSAVTVRVTARDQFGNLVHNGVVAGPSVQCVVSMSPPAGIVPTCEVAIKVKGTGAEKNRVMRVDFGDVPCDVSGLSSVALHEVRSIEFEPETCSACDTWVGTESALITSVGLPSIVVSDASLGTFGVSSHAVGGADVDEDCDDASDCDNDRRLHVSNIGSSGQDGVAIDLDDDVAGGSVSFRTTSGPPGRIVIIRRQFADGQEASRVVYSDDPLAGGGSLVCDATASGATAMGVYFRDSSGQVLLSRREQTGVLALACTAGLSTGDQTWSSLHHRWSIDLSTPDTLMLPDGTGVAGVSSVLFVPLDSPVAASLGGALELLSNDATLSVDIRHVNQPPTAVRFHGIQCVAVDEGHFTEQSDGSLLVSTPLCCLDDDSDDDGVPDGIEMLYHSTYGGGLTLTIAQLMQNSSQNREIRIRPKGWDGTIKGSLRISGGGGGGAGGSIGLECDFSPMGAVEVQWEARDVGGAVLASGTAAGSTLGGITVTPEPQGSFLAPALMQAKEKANKMVCAFVLPDRDCDVDGLTPATMQGVRSLEFRPIEPAGSPPWADLESLEVTFAGMESLTLLDASLLTFGVVGNGIKDVQIGEVCDDSNQCDESRRLEVRNLGSLGEDGVAFHLGNPVDIAFDGANLNLARGNCCRGHVILMKAYDDGEQEVARVLSSSSADGTTHTMDFDASARPGGPYTATCTVTDADGDTLAASSFGGPAGGITYVGTCDAGNNLNWNFGGERVTIELCDGPVTVFLDGVPVPNARHVTFIVDGTPPEIRSFQLTSNATDGLDISGLVLNEVGPPICPADFDGDGVRAVPDIFAFLSAWFAQDPAAYNFGGVSGVPAIFAFLSVWFAGCA